LRQEPALLTGCTALDPRYDLDPKDYSINERHKAALAAPAHHIRDDLS
jgi:hypothetical protein